MCGIHGIISGSKGERNADDFLKSAFVANTLRGMDAAGLVVINSKTNVFDMHKMPIAGQFFKEAKASQELFRQATAGGAVSIGHVRHATSGGHSIDTAHPFECYDEKTENSLVGVHNGTLTAWHSKKDAKYYSVDSEWALSRIMNEGADAFEDFSGAFCFVWWNDKKPGVLNIALNKERPMHVVMLEDGGMAFASEGGMLYWLLERHSVKMVGSILELTPDYWYEFPIEDCSKFTKSKLVSFKTPAVTTTPYYSRKTVVQEVQELFTNIVKEAAQAKAKSAKVSEDEHKNAIDFDMLGDQVLFSPINTFENGTEGIVTVGGADFSAHVVEYSPSTLDDRAVWTCAVIGVDTHNAGDPVLLLDTPTILARAKVSVH